VSAILMRPIREQFEHDRVIRLLQTRFRKSKKKYVVGANVGEEKTAAVRVGTKTFHPDLVLMSADRSRRILGVVEVETSESVTTLEAMAQWAHFGKLKGAFYLYVPAGTAEIARRLCDDNRVEVAEIWTYFALGQQMRFALAYRGEPAPKPVRAPRPRKPAVRQSETVARSTKGAARKSSRTRTRSPKDPAIGGRR
jgi:hypothetical protein